MKNENQTHRIVVVGDIGTGKTAFIEKYVNKVFSSHYETTVGPNFVETEVPIGDDIIKLTLMDINGKDRFFNMTKLYYEEVVGAFVLIDCKRIDTIEGAQQWKHDLNVRNNWSGVYPSGMNPVILLVNKVDLLDDDEIINVKYDEFCVSHKFHSWIPISVKSDIGIDEAFFAMANICKKSKLITEDLESQEFVNDYLDDIFNISNDTERNLKYIMAALRSIDFGITAGPKSDNQSNDQSNDQSKDIVKEYQLNKELRYVSDKIHDILVDDNVCESDKPAKILNFVLRYRRDKMKKNW